MEFNIINNSILKIVPNHPEIELKNSLITGEKNRSVIYLNVRDDKGCNYGIYKFNLVSGTGKDGEHIYDIYKVESIPQLKTFK